MSPPPEDLSGFSMQDLFRAEVETHATTLEEGLVELEADPGNVQIVEPLMRAAHSIKGAARIVGLEGIVHVAHAMEDLLVAAQKGEIELNSPAVDALLVGTDLLRRVGGLSEGETEAFFRDQKDVLDEAVDRLRRAGRGEALEDEPGAAAVPASPPSGEAPPRAAPRTLAGGAAAVRVDSEVFTRMLAYAGESVVQARHLAQHTDDLDAVRRAVERLATSLEAVRDRLRRDGVALPEPDPIAALRQEADQVQALVVERAAAFDEATRKGADLAGRMYRQVLTSRMRPLREGVLAFPRMVRDLARELGKKVRLEVLGRDVPVDRDILERLEAPLNHMLRNALDHGIETAAEREVAGKSPVGHLRLEARHHAGQLEIRVEDDGRGMKVEDLRRRVVERELIGAEIAADLSEAELMEFLFLPGFSTTHAVTEISGRGVGLDVVHTMVREAGGSVRARRRESGGLSFLLVLPITRSVIRVAVLEIAGEPFAFPLTEIERLVRVEADDVRSIENRQSFQYDGRVIGLVPASDVLGLRVKPRHSDVLYVVIVRSGEHEYGLVVDRYLGEQSLVVRTLDMRLGAVANVSAVSLDAQGDPLVILDVQDLVHSVDQLLHEGRLRSIRATRRGLGERRRPRKRILVVDDSITVREVERKLLATRGYTVDVCVDGADAWNAVRAQEYDLVLTDVDMPRMGGIELVRLIREDARLRGTPVMIVSYKEKDEDRMRGLEAGANAYLTKSSFHDETLVREVADLIGDPIQKEDA